MSSCVKSLSCDFFNDCVSHWVSRGKICIESLENAAIKVINSVALNVLLNLTLFYMHNNFYVCGLIVGCVFNSHVVDISKKMEIIFATIKALPKKYIFFAAGPVVFLAYVSRTVVVALTALYFASKLGAQLYRYCDPIGRKSSFTASSLELSAYLNNVSTVNLFTPTKVDDPQPGQVEDATHCKVVQVWLKCVRAVKDAVIKVVYSVAVSIILHSVLSLGLFCICPNFFVSGLIIGCIFNKKFEEIGNMVDAVSSAFQKLTVFGKIGIIAVAAVVSFIAMPVVLATATLCYSAYIGAKLYRQCDPITSGGGGGGDAGSPGFVPQTPMNQQINANAGSPNAESFRGGVS